MSSEKKFKIAVLCSGLDSKLRGYETHQRTLFNCFASEDYDVTLYKRDGKGIKNKEIALRTPSYKSLISKLFSKYYDTPLQCQMAFFAVAFVLHSFFMKKKYKHIMIIEPGLLRIVYKLRNFLPGHPKLVYTHGINNDPKYYINYCDEIIEVSEPTFKITKKYSERMSTGPNLWLIPHFVEKQELFIKNTKNTNIKQLKTRLGIRTEKVLLHVGVVCRKPKNVDYIINEFSQLPDDWTLLLIGNVVDKDILDIGYKTFGDRLVQTALLREDMWIPYYLSDLLVFASTEEGFGIVIIEALASELPILLPKIPLYSWITNNNSEMLYELESGGLSRKILANSFSKSWISDQKNYGRNLVAENYTWDSVKPLYEELFKG